MARRVYFAFHYEDVKSFRANVVRNSWYTKDDREYGGFYDASLWEEARKKGDDGIQRMIDAGLENTSVTAVLVGTDTYSRPWVKYEMLKSFDRKNGLMAIHINSIPDKDRTTDVKGNNPLDYVGFRVSKDTGKIVMFHYTNGEWQMWGRMDNWLSTTYSDGSFYQFSKLFPVYDWMANDGYNNFTKWVEAEAKKVGR